MANLRTPPLKSLGLASEIVLNNELRRQFENGKLDLERSRSLLEECAATKVTLDTEELAYALKAHLDRVSDRFARTPQDMEGLKQFADAADLARNVPFGINLWKPQKYFYEMIIAMLPEMQQCAARGNAQAGVWVEKFLALGEKLGFGAVAGAR